MGYFWCKMVIISLLGNKMTDNKKSVFGRLFDTIRPPFLEDSTPPPFYEARLSAKTRQALDKAFIGERSQAYYLAQFARIDKAGRLIPSWHWAAFVNAFGWLLYRKRYLDCFVYCVAGVSFVKLNIVVLLAVLEFVFIGALPEDWRWIMRGVVALLVWLFWAAVVARWANAYYYRMARREIADALALYPNDITAQSAHLAHHGKTSLVGLSAAFALFAVLLWAFGGQLMPLYVKKQEHKLVDDAYRTLIQTKRQIGTACPIGALSSDRYHLSINSAVDGVASDCAIVLYFANVTYPLGYLNGHRLVLYRNDGRWQCQSSLGSAQLPTHCHD